MSDVESAIWRSIQSLAARFQAADLIVLGVPMRNFAYPYKLKQLIDLVCQRNFLFTFSEGKFGPLLKTRNAAVIYSRGQTYAEHSPTPASLFDHPKSYIDFGLHFVDAEKTHSIVIENPWSGKKAETLAKGKSEAIRLVGQS
jgi:FMN-dependent NADH-azoreductase